MTPLSFIGRSPITATYIDAFIRNINRDAPAVGSYYVDFGHKFGIRPDLAVALSVLETGWFRSYWFLTHNNPGGLDVTGVPGAGQKFSTIEQGIHALFERLASYVFPVCPHPDCGKYDRNHGHWRFRQLMRTRGSADTLSDVSSLWAADPKHADKIYAIWQKLTKTLPPDKLPPIPDEKSNLWIYLIIAGSLVVTGLLVKKFVSI